MIPRRLAPRRAHFRQQKQKKECGNYAWAQVDPTSACLPISHISSPRDQNEASGSSLRPLDAVVTFDENKYCPKV